MNLRQLRIIKKDDNTWPANEYYSAYIYNKPSFPVQNSLINDIKLRLRFVRPKDKEFLPMDTN